MLSIIIPSFNRQAYLRSTLAALIQQKLSIPWEIIVVDSGNDGTDALLSTHFPSVRYLRIATSKNRSQLRNEGAKLAQGDILLFIDNDMITPPGYLQGHVDMHGSHANIVCLAKRKYLVNMVAGPIAVDLACDTTGLMDQLPFIEDLRIENATALGDHLYPWRFCFSHGVSVKKALFNTIGGFDPVFGENWGLEDLELGYRLQKHGASFALLQGLDAYHQPHWSPGDKETDIQKINRDVFARKHQSFDAEMEIGFGVQCGKLLASAQRTRDKSDCNLVDLHNYPEDLIFGVARLMHEPALANGRLGVYIPAETPSVPTIRIIKDFFEYALPIQLMILKNALNLAKQVNVALTDERSIQICYELAAYLGLELSATRSGDCLQLSKTGEHSPRIIIIRLPGINQPGLRYWNHLLAIFLHEHQYLVQIFDAQLKTDANREEFILTDDQRAIIDSLKQNFFGGLPFKVILPETDLFTMPDAEPSLLSFVLENQGFASSTNNPSDDAKAGFSCIADTAIDLFSLGYASIIPAASGLALGQNQQFMVFMFNGFLEDGIDLILAAFVQLGMNYPKSRLVIKVLDFANSRVNCFGEFNQAAQDISLFDHKNKHQANISRLKAAIYDLGLIDKTEIITNATTLDERQSLYRKSAAVLSVGIDNFIGIETYEALFSNCHIIVAEHKIRHPSLNEYGQLHLAPVHKINYADAMHVPFDSGLSHYNAHQVDVPALAKLLENLLVPVSTEQPRPKTYDYRPEVEAALAGLLIGL